MEAEKVGEPVESVVRRSLAWYLVIMVTGLYNIGMIVDPIGKIINVIVVTIASALFIGLFRDWYNLRKTSDLSDVEPENLNTD